MCATAVRSGALEIEKKPLPNNVLKSAITYSAECASQPDRGQESRRHDERYPG
jgi:hypothetical protein